MQTEHISTFLMFISQILFLDVLESLLTFPIKQRLAIATHLKK